MKKSATKTTKAAEPKKSTAEIVTSRILEIIETTGSLPWLKPWMSVAGNGSAPRNFITGKAYQGINALLLFSVQQVTGYSSPYWLTFKQAQDKGGCVRRGEKGTPVVYYNFVEVDDDETGDEKKIPFLKHSTVFNLAQVDGVEIPTVETATAEAPTFNPIEAAEAILAGAPLPQINHGGNHAYYSPRLDYIQMPKIEQFKGEAEYYNTLFHEVSHSSGHASRLARKGVTESTYFGSHEYSKEELIAEITAASLSHEAGLFESIDRNSAAYVKSWAKALKDDKNMIIQAAGAAQKAFDYILNRMTVILKEAA
jgi:antirestriction protein ArdC